MITNITLENFKCFRQVSINPKRLTVLIGPNGTGQVRRFAGAHAAQTIDGYAERFEAFEGSS